MKHLGGYLNLHSIEGCGINAGRSPLQQNQVIVVWSNDLSSLPLLHCDTFYLDLVNQQPVQGMIGFHPFGCFSFTGSLTAAFSPGTTDPGLPLYDLGD